MQDPLKTEKEISEHQKIALDLLNFLIKKDLKEGEAIIALSTVLTNFMDHRKFTEGQEILQEITAILYNIDDDYPKKRNEVKKMLLEQTQKTVLENNITPNIALEDYVENKIKLKQKLSILNSPDELLNLECYVEEILRICLMFFGKEKTDYLHKILEQYMQIAVKSRKEEICIH